MAADMHRIGQLRARDSVHFQEVSLPEALRLLRQQEQ
jgi:allophanate hydrolase subunit 2